MFFSRSNAHFHLAAVLTFVAWLLLLLVVLSTPITHSIYLAQVDAHVRVGGIITAATVDTDLRFGVYGYCSSGSHTTQLNGVFSQDRPAQCSQRKLGYSFDSKVLDLLQIDGVTDDVSTTITFGLATHVVAAVLSFNTLLAVLATAHTQHLATWWYTTVSAGLATLFGLIAFIFDAVFVREVRHALRRVNNLVTVSSGNAVWMTLVAWLLLLIITALATTGLVRARRSRLYAEKPYPHMRQAI